MTYDGWKNWETWNVALWCDNEAGIYHDRMRAKPRTAKEVEKFVREYFPAGTPDIENAETDPYNHDEVHVDWQEIADHWSEDYGDEKSDAA
jgi:hypothetical protein